MVKTTLTIQDDVYARLKQIYGPRGVSKAINEILSGNLPKQESMFGSMKKTNVRDLRDHRDGKQ
jgi:predicted CopG family antitoxin